MPETPWLLKQPTKYSGYTKRGRGMPTFKQYKFFQHAAEHWAAVPFVAKFDDDTAPSLRLLLPLLASLHPRCRSSPGPHKWVFGQRGLPWRRVARRSCMGHQLLASWEAPAGSRVASP